jgi:hypothetical protein
MSSTKKYAMMMKVGLAEGAVRAKMTQDGFTDAQIDEFIAGGGGGGSAPAPAAAPELNRTASASSVSSASGGGGSRRIR